MWRRILRGAAMTYNQWDESIRSPEDRRVRFRDVNTGCCAVADGIAALSGSCHRQDANCRARAVRSKLVITDRRDVRDADRSCR